MNTVTLDNRQYSIGKLDVFQQFHVARRMAPLMMALLGAVRSTPGSTDSVPDVSLDATSGALADALSTMKEEDVNYVLYSCLSVVKVVENGNSLVGLYDKNSKMLRYSDITMQTMLALAINVIQDNLGSFFLSGQQESIPAQG